MAIDAVYMEQLKGQKFLLLEAMEDFVKKVLGA